MLWANHSATRRMLGTGVLFGLQIRSVNADRARYHGCGRALGTARRLLARIGLGEDGRVCDKNVEPFEDVTATARKRYHECRFFNVRGSASCRSRPGFRPFLHAFHFYVAHPRRNQSTRGSPGRYRLSKYACDFLRPDVQYDQASIEGARYV